MEIKIKMISGAITNNLNCKPNGCAGRISAHPEIRSNGLCYEDDVYGETLYDPTS